MNGQVLSGAVQGVDAVVVQVQMSSHHPGQNEPRTTIVGLPETAVRESSVRIRAALGAMGVPSCKMSVTINLAPAHIRKSGTAYDLPMALAMLVARGALRPPDLHGWMAVGEVSLNGDVRPVRGVLPIAVAARDAGVPRLAVPAANAPEAAVVEGVQIVPVASVGGLIEVMRGEAAPPPIATPPPVDPRGENDTLDLADVRGQERAKRALELAAAGGHGLLMQGPPGSGKSMLAKRLTTILPTMSLDESLDVTKVYSVAGLLRPGEGVRRTRPFRAPHHTASDVALVGGGSHPRPGEISLAHNGVLFLDEMPEFRRSVLEVLRQPLEDRFVTISRAAISCTFPAHFTLVAALNPCACGYHGSTRRPCRCSEQERLRYVGRLSGPLLDRIDLHVTVSDVPFAALHDERRGEPSAAVRARVETARERQRARYTGDTLTCNAGMGPRALRRWCRLPPDAEALLGKAVERFGLSARAHDRVLRVARTVADLEGADALSAAHLVEALELRGCA